MFDVTSASASSALNKSTIDPSIRPMSQTPIIEKRRNYRFYAGDPAIHPADKRLYANGDFEGTPLHVSGGTDPRNASRPDRSCRDLPIPQFKLDRCWVGVIPAKEVTFRNLNDNITKTFLTDMCKRFGDIDDCKIYYDRQTRKHLGLGTVTFKTTKAARECVNALNMSTKMGSVISVSLETSGQERTKQYATLLRAQEQEKMAQEKALAASAAASPPAPPANFNSNKQADRSQTSLHSSNNNSKSKRPSQSSAPSSKHEHHSSSSSKSASFKRTNLRTPVNPKRSYRHENSSSTAARHDARGHHSSNDTNEQFSFDPYGSFGNSNNHKSSSSSSHRARHRTRRNSHNRPSSQQRPRRRRKSSSSASSTSASRSSSSSSSRSSASSTSSSTSKSGSSTSSSSRSNYSSDRSRNRKSANDSHNNHSKAPYLDEDQRPSLDERIAALFQQQQQTSIPSSMPSKAHHRPLPLPNAPPPTVFSIPAPPPMPTPITNVVGSHHHHQQSYGVVNNFNFFGNSFPPASFLNSTGGTNWQDMFKQPPPSSSTTTTTTTTINYSSSHSSNGLQPHLTDSHDERERKTNDLTTAVSNIVTGELVDILRRDLAKKLIETLVYKSIETWYDNEERKDKIRKIKSAEQSTIEAPAPAPTTSTQEPPGQLQHSISNPVFERTPEEIAAPLTAPILNSSSSTSNVPTYFEQMRDSSGLSVRSQMPKIPTFKKRTLPEEKLLIPEKTPAPKEKKDSSKPLKSRKLSRKPLTSSSSPSSISSDDEDSQSRDSVLPVHEDHSSSETKAQPRTPPHEQPTPEEEEGEIKDDEEVDSETQSTPMEAEPIRAPSPPPPPPPPPAKKVTKKNPVKPSKKPSPPKKRKIETVKTEPVQEQDDLDSSTAPKRKKSATNLHSPVIQKEEPKPIQTFNLLDSLPEQVHTVPVPHDRFAYIQFEHNYAIMTKQPVLVAKRLTIDGLHDLGVQVPTMVVPVPVPVPKYPAREHEAEMRIMYDIDHGIDEEDMSYLKQSFQILCNEGHSCTTKTRWVDHPPTRDSPFVKQTPQKHRTGCARTEGYYKIVKEEKISPLKSSSYPQSTAILPQAIQDINRTTGAQMSRELRSENRRNLAALGDAEFADHFKFSQLKLRKKRLRYAKSSIHSWGLFACEPIAMEDMVIEYVGETIRQSVGDLREKHYELEGIDSNYMFRIDSDAIVDATKCGNLARFINHSCDPNCYAKIIPVESQKKIVIYSKRDIRLGEEITYDYKFPLEEQKIPCRCGTSTCRGSLN